MSNYQDFILYMLAAGVLAVVVVLAWCFLRARHRNRLQDGNRRL